jgi:hypothetical protein
MQALFFALTPHQLGAPEIAEGFPKVMIADTHRKRALGRFRRSISRTFPFLRLHKRGRVT